MPLRNLPLPTKVLQDAAFTSLQERMAKDLFAFDAEQRKENDALSLERIGELQLPEDGGITGTTGYESMLGDTEASGADEGGGMAPEASDEYAAAPAQPRRSTGLMSPTLDMPAMSQPRRQAVYDPTQTVDIQGEPDYDPSADTGTVFSGPSNVPNATSNATSNATLPTIAGKFPEEQARIYQQARASGLDDEGARVLVAVSETEGGARGAVGDNGRARGVYQFHDGGEFPSFAAWVRKNGIEGDPAALAVDPEVSTRYAAEGYLGQAIKRGREMGYSGAELATYVQRTGQRSIRPETTGENYTRLFGNQPASSAAAPAAPVAPTQRAAESRNQTGETRLSRVSYPLQQDLTVPEKWAVCGPLAIMGFAAANGTPIDYETAKAKAIAAGWTNAGMAGPGSQVAALKSVGVPARMEPVNWETVTADVRNGNPVMLSSPGESGHYFIVQGVDDQGRLDLGNSAMTLKAAGGRRWFTPQELRSLGPIGAVDTAIYMDSPASPTPSHAATAEKMPSINDISPAKIIRERDALALTAGLPPAGSPQPPAGGPTPAGGDPLDDARAQNQGGQGLQMKAEQPADAPTPDSAPYPQYRRMIVRTRPDGSVVDSLEDENFQTVRGGDEGTPTQTWYPPGTRNRAVPGTTGLEEYTEPAPEGTYPESGIPRNAATPNMDDIGEYPTPGQEHPDRYPNQISDQIQYRQPLDSGVPVRDRWADDVGGADIPAAERPQVPYDPDQGPREAPPGSVGAQPIISPMAPPENTGVSVTAAQPAPPQIQISQGGPPTPSAQWTPVETVPTPQPRQLPVWNGQGQVVGYRQEDGPVNGPQEPVNPLQPGTIRPSDLPNAGQPLPEGRIDVPGRALPQGGITVPQDVLDQTVPRAAQAVNPPDAPRYPTLLDPSLRAGQERAPWQDEQRDPATVAPTPPGIPTLPGVSGRTLTEATQAALRSPSQSISPISIYAALQELPFDVYATARRQLVSDAEARRMSGTDPLAPFREMGVQFPEWMSPENLNPEGRPASDVAMGLLIAGALPDPADPAVALAFRGAGRAIGLGARGVQAAGRAIAPVAEAGARAAGRAGYALAEEGARQLMDLTPSPRIVQEGGGVPIGRGGAASVPNSASSRGIDALYHETSPQQAFQFLNSINGDAIRGLHVTPDPEFALGQSGKGALIEFGNTDQIGITPNRSKPGLAMMEEAGQRTPEWMIQSVDQQPSQYIRSITVRPDAEMTRIADGISSRLEGRGWTVETLPDGARRFTAPSPDDGVQMLGSGVVPRGLRADAFNAAQGGVVGAASEDLQAQQEGREADPAERARRALIGAGLATAGGRYARRGPAAERALGSGAVPGGGGRKWIPDARYQGGGFWHTPSPRMPAAMQDAQRATVTAGADYRTAVRAREEAETLAARHPDDVEVRQRLTGALAQEEHAQQTLDAAREHLQMVQTGDMTLGSGVVPEPSPNRGQRPTRAIEQALTSDYGRKIQNTRPLVSSAEDLADAKYPRDAVHPDIRQDMTGPVGIPTDMRGRQNAALPFDPSSAAAGGAAGAASEDEEGQQGDPLRTGAGMLMAGVLGRRFPGVAAAQKAAARRAAHMKANGITRPSAWDWLKQAGYAGIYGPATFVNAAVGGAQELVLGQPKEAIRAVAAGRPGSYGRQVAAQVRAMPDGLTGLGRVLWGSDSAATARVSGGSQGTADLSERIVNPAGHMAARVLEKPGEILTEAPDAVFRPMFLAQGMQREADKIAAEMGMRGTSATSYAETLIQSAEQLRANPAARSTSAEAKRVVEAGAAYADELGYKGNPGGFGRWLGQAAKRDDGIGVLASFLVPFPSMVGRMTRAAARSTPGVGLLPAIRRGQKTKFDVVYDQAFGTLVAGGVAAWAFNGGITGSGPSDTEKRRMMVAEGWQPNSTLVDGYYIPNRAFGRFQPMLDAAGELHDALAYKKADYKTEDLVDDLVKRTSRVVTDQTGLSGIADLHDMWQQGFSAQFPGWATRSAARYVPYAGILRAAATSQDTKQRRPDRSRDVGYGETFAQNVEMIVPGLRENVPAVQDVLGREAPNPQQDFGAFIPRTSTQRDDPILNQFQQAGVDIGAPRSDITEDGVKIDLSPTETRRWNELRGQEIIKSTQRVIDNGILDRMNPVRRAERLDEIKTEAAERATEALRREIGVREFSRRRREARQPAGAGAR